MTFWGCNRAHGLVQTGRIVDVHNGYLILKVPFFLEYTGVGEGPGAHRPSVGEWDVVLHTDDERLIGLADQPPVYCEYCGDGSRCAVCGRTDGREPLELDLNVPPSTANRW